MNKSGAHALPGFLVSGFLVGLLGALLPAWGYHLAPHHRTAGTYFLFLFLGGLAGGVIVQQWRIPRAPALACGLASVSLLLLPLVSPPAADLWRMAGWAAIGISVRVLNTSLFEALHTGYSRDPAGTAGLGGIYFGLGCLGSAILLAGTFYLYSLTAILIAVAMVPGVFAVLYWRRPLLAPADVPQPGVGEAWRDFWSPGVLLFALLLFFQSGNEWILAGWLPIFLIHRLGISPETSLWILALYWLALLVGRVAVVYLLAKVKHSRLLFSGAGASLCGCLLLILTDNRLGAFTGILLAGSGFAAIYPLVAERIGRRFPYYHPGIFHGIFSIALAGGMLLPWLAGILADWVGLWVVMAMPALGMLIVAILILLIWLEGKVTGR